MVSSDYFPDILLSSPAEHTSGSPYQKLNPHKAGSLPRPRNAQVCPENAILWQQLQALRKTNINWAAIS